MSNWYYSKNGEQKGPISEEELLAKKTSGEVLATDLVWKEGMSDWLPLGQVAGISGGTDPLAPPSASGSPVSQPRPYSEAYAQQMQNVPTYLWQSIVVTLLCCMPLGVVSIVYAAKVDGLVARGDIPGAQAASKSAKNWALAALLSGLGITLIYIIIAVAAAGSNM